MFGAFTRWFFKSAVTVREFEAENPGARVLASGPAKAIRFAPGSDETLRRGPQWAYSLRGTLIATDELLGFRLNPKFDKLHDVASGFTEFASFRIPAAEIAAAELQPITNARGLLLKISHASGASYHFGLMPDDAWLQAPFIRGHPGVRLGWSRFRVIARLKLAAALAIMLALLAAAYWLQFR